MTSLPTLNLIELIPDDLRALLWSSGALSVISIFEERKGVFENDINAVLATQSTGNRVNGKPGAAILIGVPNRTVKFPNAAGPRWTVEFTIRVLENSLINRAATGTGLTAEAISVYVEQLCHQYGLSKGILLVSEGAVPVMVQDSKLRGYDVKITAEIQPDAALVRTTSPLITFSASGENFTVTLTCSDGEATIYYTTDGTYPWPGDADLASTATLYSAPFSVSPCTVVRAAAFNPTKEVSVIAAKNIR